MVYCTKCGTENPDDATVCKNCGAPLNPPIRSYGRRDREMDDWCFGGRGRNAWPLIIGVFIILIGLSSLLDQVYPWANFDNIWPLFLIALGLIIIYYRVQR
jgi:uncharacterized membrane protein YvbJ